MLTALLVLSDCMTYKFRAQILGLCSRLRQVNLLVFSIKKIPVRNMWCYTPMSRGVHKVVPDLVPDLSSVVSNCDTKRLKLKESVCSQTPYTIISPAQMANRMEIHRRGENPSRRHYGPDYTIHNKILQTVSN